MSQLTPFQKSIVKVVRSIPPGRVMSYGQVALYLDQPRAARQVGWAMSHLEGVDFPWWRVVNNAGRISIKGRAIDAPAVQKQLLKAEGVEFTGDLTFDINRYRFYLDTISPPVTEP